MQFTMLRSSLPLARGSYSLLRPTARSSRTIKPVAASIQSPQRQQIRFASAPHAISNPTLASIEKRWEGMPPQEQATLWMQLRDRMEQDWHHLTMQEKKAAYWIAFGNHGPRALPPPGENIKIFWYTMSVVGIAVVIFFIIRSFARGPPRTMNKEWQEATNEYLKSQNSEPITGISSEKYEGKGYVQSK